MEEADNAVRAQTAAPSVLAAAPAAVEAREVPKNVAGIERWLLPGLLALAALERIYLAWTDQGVVWSDEIFQSLEQAHRAVFGYGLIPWEFREAARSWLFPGAIALLWKPIAWLHLDRPLALVMIARLAMIALGLWGLWCTARLAMRLAPENAREERVDPKSRAAIWTVLLGAALPISLLFSFRALTEVASAPLLVAGVLWLLEGKTRRAGLAIGAASFLRYQSALAGLAILIWLLARRRWREAGQAVAGAAVIAAASGLLDWITWGEPFLPLARYVEINLFEGKASQFGVEPAAFYLRAFVAANGVPASIAIALGLLLIARRAPGLLAIGLGFIAAHSLVPHKELRFILPVLPLLIALAAAGLARLPGRGEVPAIATAVAMAALLFAMTTRARALDFGELGDGMMHPAGVKVWHSEEASNRMMLEASSRADLCGLTVLSAPAWFTGGYTYLHRDVPLLFGAKEANFEASNYVIALLGTKGSKAYVKVAEWRGTGLFRREGPCSAPPPGYSRSF